MAFHLDMYVSAETSVNQIMYEQDKELMRMAGLVFGDSMLQHCPIVAKADGTVKFYNSESKVIFSISERTLEALVFMVEHYDLDEKLDLSEIQL